MTSGLTEDLHIVAATYARIESDKEDAWLRVDCPACGGAQAVRIAYTRDGSDRPSVTWARCVNCFHGLVKNGEKVSPGRKPLRNIKGLEADVATAWAEVRGCLSTGATTAAVHMCRKILLHVAVQEGLQAKDARGRAPGFVECIDHLKRKGYVTPPMEKWVDKIRQVGNQGAHELEATSAEAAALVAQFTLQLLVLTYEMSAFMDETQGSPIREKSDPVL